jgi:hypothetical protein
MASHQASGRLAAGARVVVRAGVASPDFPEVSFGGWTGSIVETSGRKPNVKFFVEWDADTLTRMPADYVARCEAQQLYHRMACLGADDLEPAGE